MNEEFKNYLAKVGVVSPVIVDRVEDLLAMAVDTGLMKQVDDVYVSEYIGFEGVRVCEHLLLFSGDRMLMAEHFLTKDLFKVVRLKELGGLQIEPEEYDLRGKATGMSRLRVRVDADGDEPIVDGTATMENCDALRSIMLKYWLPNVRQ